MLRSTRNTTACLAALLTCICVCGFLHNAPTFPLHAHRSRKGRIHALCTQHEGMLHTKLCCLAVCRHSHEATRRRNFVNVIFALIHLSTLHALVRGCLNTWRHTDCVMFRCSRLLFKPSEIALVSWLNGMTTTRNNLAILVF